MSKKHKQPQKQQKKVQSQDLNDADLSHFFGLLGQDYENNGTLKVTQKILGDYKTLLEFPPNKFWATIAYNLDLQNSLDLFLRYAPRRHFLTEPLHLSGYYGLLVKEIFKCVLAIYLRLTDLQSEDIVLYEYIGVYDLLYQKWILDVMKLTDICQIYGENNESAVKKICEFVFKFQAYQDDFKSTVESYHRNVLVKLYEDLFLINNKSQNETEIIISDVQQKMELLTLLLDSIETAIVWATYFKQPNSLFRVEVIQIFEQIFYELLLAKGYNNQLGAWKAHCLPIMLNFLKQAISRLILFFILYFAHLGELITTKQIKQVQEHMINLIQNFGVQKRKFKSKKGSQNKEWTLIEALNENGFNIIELMLNTPWNQINVPKEDVEEVTLLITSSLEERERLKDLISKKKPEDFEAYENLDPTQFVLPEDQEEVEEQVIEQPTEYKDENLVEIVPKKKQKMTFDQPLKDRIEMAEITAKLYNDEPDDTYDYQEALQRPEKEYTSSDEGDEVNDMVHKDHYERYGKVLQKPSNPSSHYSASYSNLDSEVRVLKKQNKRVDEAQFSDEDDDQQYSRDAQYNNNRGANNNQNNNSKYFVKENNSDRRNDNNFNRNKNKKYDEDYVRDDQQQKQNQQNYADKKVITKNRDGGYIGKNRTKGQEEFEEKQTQEKPKQQQQQYQQYDKQGKQNQGNNKQNNNQNNQQNQEKSNQYQEKQTQQNKYDKQNDNYDKKGQQQYQDKQQNQDKQQYQDKQQNQDKQQYQDKGNNQRNNNQDKYKDKQNNNNNTNNNRQNDYQDKKGYNDKKQQGQRKILNRDSKPFEQEDVYQVKQEENGKQKQQ